MRPFKQALNIAKKEWRLLLRNPHGLAVLFLMPAAFILVMSFALKNTLTSANVEFPNTGWVIEDSSPIATQWAGEWIARNGGERFASRTQLHEALRARQVQAGVIVQPQWLDEQGKPRADHIQLWLSNRIQPSAAGRLRAELSYSMLQVQMKIAAAAAGPFASILLGSASSAELLPATGALTIRYLYEIESGRKMSAVQQSVPAWLIFGMFFVVIPIAGVLIQERNDGTLTRMATFGVTPGAVLGGKLMAFMALNWVQLLLMLLVGRWLVPALGGDTLYLDLPIAWFLLMVLATSAAAVGLALVIAAHTRTFDHAAALGGGANVVLGAIAGIMVPRTLMPAGMQTLSEWSPMGWALDGMQAVFLGAPDAAQIVPKASLLLAFAGVCLLLSWQPIRHPERVA
ncbi:ABC transporter permease [Piscinibacter sp.]|jgi:ABC-2 type transport system permease protein|uniref:ABC transporter permease n=1 Tax=Piscinibacter sp. TaxID=1903157 RepID=UPI002F419A65